MRRAPLLLHQRAVAGRAGAAQRALPRNAATLRGASCCILAAGVVPNQKVTGRQEGEIVAGADRGAQEATQSDGANSGENGEERVLNNEVIAAQ
jgi:hypothetical protein